jgi:hypothetical protein
VQEVNKSRDLSANHQDAINLDDIHFNGEISFAINNDE